MKPRQSSLFFNLVKLARAARQEFTVISELEANTILMPAAKKIEDLERELAAVNLAASIRDGVVGD